MVKPSNDFAGGEWSMFKQITDVYFQKEYYFLEKNGTVYSRLSHQTFANKESAYNEFFEYLWRDI